MTGVSTELVCVICDQVQDVRDDHFAYVVDNDFSVDDVVCLTCINKHDIRRCECCFDLTPPDEMDEDQHGNPVCIYCRNECRGAPGCQIAQERADKAYRRDEKADHLAEVRRMVTSSAQWLSENERTSKL